MMIPIPDFTVGNTITIAIAIYKQNWKKYLKLSLIAHLWLLVPVYGWARYFAIAAWISKLSLNELVAQPDNIEHKQYFTIRSLFIFMFTALVTIFTILIAIVLCYFFIIILLICIAFLLQIIFNSPIVDNLNQIIDKEEGVAFWTFFWGIILLFSLASTLSYVRLFLTDFGLTGNQTDKLFNLISQSYSLTKQKLKIFSIILQSFFLVFPVWVISFFFVIIVLSFLLWGIERFVVSEININDVYLGLSFFICWIVWTNLLTMPFWQSVKAVTYHELNQRVDYDLMSNHRQ